MRTASITPVVTDQFTASRVALNGPGYKVHATSLSLTDEFWSVGVDAGVDHGIPDRHHVRSADLVQTMTEMSDEIELVLRLELHLSPVN